jgi:hypothetical protein
MQRKVNIACLKVQEPSDICFEESQNVRLHSQPPGQNLNLQPQELKGMPLTQP